MKKILGIVAVMLFFLLLLAATIFKLLGSGSDKAATTQLPSDTFVPASPEGSDTSSAPYFVESFYKWYIDSITQDPFFPEIDERNKYFTPWVTSDFLAKWRVADQQGSESDYILKSGADDPFAAGRNVSASILSQSVRSAEVIVTIGNGEGSITNTVELQRAQDGTWKINSILPR